VFNSLRLRLLALMVVVLLVAGGLAAWLASRAIAARFQTYLVQRTNESVARRDQLQEMLPPILAGHYQTHDGWQAVDPLLAQVAALAEERVILLDGAGAVVLDTGNPLPLPPPAELAAAPQAPIDVDGAAVGTVLLLPLPAAYHSSEAAYIASVNRSLLVAALVAGALAVLFTLTLSRRILRPVEALTTAARRMEAGDLHQRVEVATGDEIGQLAQAFNAMADSLARVEQLRRNMVSDVAHELRTPLSNIRGYLEALQDGVVQPTSATVDSLYEEAMLLQRLVDDLQELALADAGQIRLSREPVNIGEIIERAAQAALPMGNGSGIELAMELPPSLPEVEVDAERIGQVLRNLLGNAFAYTPPGGRICLHAEQRDGQVCVSVQNTGAGIAPEHLPNLFERFYRVDHSRSRATGGSGLGLAIVKQLVEAHGGRVWAASVPGASTTFYFTVPLAASSRSQAAQSAAG
jgi:signal transduction histidine kinase